MQTAIDFYLLLTVIGAAGISAIAWVLLRIRTKDDENG